MTFVVLPATIPEISSLYATYFWAFHKELINKILFPAGVDHPEFRKAHAAATLDFWHKNVFDSTFKCLDTSNGEIVGMAVWGVYWRERSKEERPRPVVDWLKGDEKERAQKFLEAFWGEKEKLWGGRPLVYCHVVAVSPEYQRQGIGKLLMQWGIETAERLGLPLYLESTLAGVGLYERLGFQKLKENLVLRPDATGLDADIEAPLMVKLPPAAGDVSVEEFLEEF